MLGGMIRFSHTLFAMPFAMLALVMAWAMSPTDTTNSVAESAGWMEARFPGLRWIDLVGVLLCMVCARSAAMAFNRIVDRFVDAENPRTRERHLPTGVVSVWAATALTIVASIGFVAVTLLFLPRNPLPFVCAVPVLIFLLGYSWAKRFTDLSHYWLGAALGLAPVGAWVVVRATFLEPAPWLLAVAVACWVGGFDIIYACQDTEFDRRRGLHSLPARFGNRVALRLAAVSHGVMLMLLALMPMVYTPFHSPTWFIGLAAVGVLLAIEHRLVTPDDLARVNVAFFHVNVLVSFGLLAIGTLTLLFPSR